MRRYLSFKNQSLRLFRNFSVGKNGQASLFTDLLFNDQPVQIDSQITPEQSVNQFIEIDDLDEKDLVRHKTDEMDGLLINLSQISINNLTDENLVCVENICRLAKHGLPNFEALVRFIIPHKNLIELFDENFYSGTILKYVYDWCDKQAFSRKNQELIGNLLCMLNTYKIIKPNQFDFIIKKSKPMFLKKLNPILFAQAHQNQPQIYGIYFYQMLVYYNKKNDVTKLLIKEDSGISIETMDDLLACLWIGGKLEISNALAEQVRIDKGHCDKVIGDLCVGILKSQVLLDFQDDFEQRQKFDDKIFKILVYELFGIFEYLGQTQSYKIFDKWVRTNQINDRILRLFIRQFWQQTEKFTQEQYTFYQKAITKFPKIIEILSLENFFVDNPDESQPKLFYKTQARLHKERLDMLQHKFEQPFKQIVQNHDQQLGKKWSDLSTDETLFINKNQLKINSSFVIQYLYYKIKKPEYKRDKVDELMLINAIFSNCPLTSVNSHKNLYEFKNLIKDIKQDTYQIVNLVKIVYGIHGKDFSSKKKQFFEKDFFEKAGYQKLSDFRNSDGISDQQEPTLNHSNEFDNSQFEYFLKDNLVVQAVLEQIDGSLSKILPRGNLNFSCQEKIFFMYTYIIEKAKVDHKNCLEIKELLLLTSKRLKRLQFGFAEIFNKRYLEKDEKKQLELISKYLAQNQIGARSFAELSKAVLTNVEVRKVKKLYARFCNTKSAMVDYHNKKMF